VSDKRRSRRKSSNLALVLQPREAGGNTYSL
jgi:hypothetical protein